MLAQNLLSSRRLQLVKLLLSTLFMMVLTTSLMSAQDQEMAPQPSQNPAPPNAVPQGTIFLIQLTDRLDTHTVKAGDHFRARLAEPLVAANGTTLDQGRKIKGHVSAVEPGLHTRLLLSFDEIETQHGWVPLIATVTGVPGEHGLRQIGEEGEIGRKGMTKEEIAEAVTVAHEWLQRGLVKRDNIREAAKRIRSGWEGRGEAGGQDVATLAIAQKCELQDDADVANAAGGRRLVRGDGERQRGEAAGGAAVAHAELEAGVGVAGDPRRGSEDQQAVADAHFDSML